MDEPTPESLSLPNDFAAVLSEHDSATGEIDEADPSFALERLLKDHVAATDSTRKAVFAEVAALQTHLLDGQQRSRWNTRFGPVLENFYEDGTVRCFPDISQIDESVISYLERRVVESSHPVLKARYADFLWDMTKAAQPCKTWLACHRQNETGRKQQTPHKSATETSRSDCGSWGTQIPVKLGSSGRLATGLGWEIIAPSTS